MSLPEPGRYLVRTLGCKANFHDSQLLESQLQQRGWRPAASEEEAELCIVNSCTVTDEADRQSRKFASRLISRNPRAVVVMTGCAAEVDPERLASSRGVAYVVGNSDKSRLVDLVLQAAGENPAKVLGQVRGYDEMASRHPMDREWPVGEEQFPAEAAPPLSEGSALRTRSFLKIQEGCNSFCTYCVIPYGRGPARSQSPDAVVKQVTQLAGLGVREVVLTGTNLGDYGCEQGLPSGVGLEQLVRRILAETQLERLRLGSLDPTEITPGLTALVRQSQSRLCPHFHVSLQSPLTRILRGMKRKYTAVEVERTLARIAAELPEAFIGMDLITGFPGEGAADFEACVKALEGLPWTRLHVFPYSERAGTPATRMPGAVPPAERTARTRQLNELSRLRHQSWIAGQGTAHLESVLFERPILWGGTGGGKRYWSGYTPNYIRVLAPYDPEQHFPHWNQQVAVRTGALWEDRQGHDFALEVLEIQEL